MIIVSRILLLKLGDKLNVANFIKNQGRRLSRFATVMFRGTPCIIICAFSIFHLTVTTNFLVLFLLISFIYVLVIFECFLKLNLRVILLLELD